MPTFKDVAPSEWLKWQDFKPSEERTYTIKAWEPSTLTQRDGKEKKTVAFYFDETTSKFGIVNKANEDSLIKIFGRGYDLNETIGKKITLWVDSWRSAAGEDQSGIRIKATVTVPTQATSDNPAATRAGKIDELVGMRKAIAELDATRLPAKPSADELTGDKLNEQLARHNNILEALKIEKAM